MKMNETRKQRIIDLLQRYKKNFFETPLSKDGADELYKWQLITKCHEKTDAEIIRNFKPINVVHVQTVYPVLTELLKNDQQQLVDCFNGLKDENRSLSERLSIFKKEMGDLCGNKFKSKANDERTAAAFLTCWNPEKYTFFIDTKVYRPYCNYIGEKLYETGDKYPHYLQLIAELAEIIKQDHELNGKFQNETKGLIQSDLLTAQNILWQMRDMMNMKEDKYINFKHLLEYFVSHLEWCNNDDTNFIGYDKYIKPLLDSKKFKYSGQGWNGGQIQEQIKQWAQYEKYTICINVYGANYQSNACYLNWEGTWINVRPLWANNHIVKLYLSKEEKSSAKEEKTKTIEELGLFTNEEPNSIIKAFFDEYEKMILEFNGLYYNKIMMEQIKEFTQILNIKKNIILQGAPGTGKTYNTAALALSICGETIPEMHEDVMKRYGELQKEGRIGFCTFHQSMDYEDFVEGIKPKTENGAISYDVEDGIFKALSDKARENYEDSQKTIEVLQRQKSIQDKMYDFLQKALENRTEFLTRLGYKFIITEITDKNIIVSIITENNIATGEPIKNSTPTISLSELTELLEKEVALNEIGDIPAYFNRKTKLSRDYYTFYIANEINKIKTKNVNVQKTELQNFVLIIDEINRGNVSKIFGELITLLEADKRIGGEHPIKVTLPYSKESFGVPSNLYIIGTMNTTDRSVGNIDYAVRRRFAFVTLKAEIELVEQNSIPTAVELFKSVESFLKKNRIDMDLDDLMVGHSYFFAKDENELALKWQYEILPLLNEYIKDNIINAKTISSNMSFADFVNTYKPKSQSDTSENNE